jgi:hypothetical protein
MASTVQRDPIGSVGGFAIVFVSFIFRGWIPAPTWVWLVVLAVGVLLAVKDGISGLDVITLGFAGFMIVGTLVSVAFRATSYTPLQELKEPIPVPAGYGFEQREFQHHYRSKWIPVKTANAAISEVVDYYIAGLAPQWTVVERKEELGYADMVNAQVKFRRGETSNGIGIQVYADVSGGSAILTLSIQALNCGDDVAGLPAGEVCWQGPV